jgi:hypothetical protein
MPLLRYGTIMLLVAVALESSVTLSYPQDLGTCQALWVERNSYYKQAGYCFKTARAISYFGNAGCLYDNENAVPLSAQVRARIDQIVRLERAYRCPN